MNGHASIQRLSNWATIYLNLNAQYGLISRQNFRYSPSEPYVRHDLRTWEAGREALRLKDGNGRILLGATSRGTGGVTRGAQFAYALTTMSSFGKQTGAGFADEAQMARSNAEAHASTRRCLRSSVRGDKAAYWQYFRADGAER
jgi:hypothetical protein